jgi:hypothetical protein
MAIAFVNATSGTADPGATTLAATAANHTTGNLIVVGVAWSTNVNANVPTDTAGNTYVSTAQKASHGTADFVEIFYAKNVTGNASNAVTANFSGSAQFRRVMVLQFSGCDTTAPFTTGEGGTVVDTSTTTHTTSSWATATADEVICCFMSCSGAQGNYTAGASFTLDFAIAGLGSDTNGEHRIVSSTGTYTGSFTTQSGPANGWAAAASFKIAGGGGATVMPMNPVVIDFAVPRAASY